MQTQTESTPALASPLELAQAQLLAYNAKDIEAFLACYSDDVQVFSYPDNLLFSGQAAMRERYLKRFADPVLYAHIAHRTVMGDVVLDQEVVRLSMAEGVGIAHLMAIYSVENGKIAAVRFIHGMQELGGQLPQGCGAPEL